jgi:hypothetical protein
MANENVSDLHFVKAFPPQAKTTKVYVMWLAATAADQAEAAVLKKLPKGWRAERTSEPVTTAQAARVKLRAGHACEFSSGG